MGVIIFEEVNESGNGRKFFAAILVTIFLNQRTIPYLKANFNEC
jgi:hypothetical protein